MRTAAVALFGPSRVYFHLPLSVAILTLGVPRLLRPPEVSFLLFVDLKLAFIGLGDNFVL